MPKWFEIEFMILTLMLPICAFLGHNFIKQLGINHDVRMIARDQERFESFVREALTETQKMYTTQMDIMQRNTEMFLKELRSAQASSERVGQLETIVERLATVVDRHLEGGTEVLNRLTRIETLMSTMVNQRGGTNE